MKKVLATSFLSLSFAFCFAQGKLAFEHTEFDFSTIKETGGPVVHDFKFKNTGDQPIIISNVQASCGCTTPEWTKTPVAPGASGMIKAQYNPSGRPGTFHKSLTITSNSIEPSTVLFIKGTVVGDAVASPAGSSTPPAPAVVPATPAETKAAPTTTKSKKTTTKKK